MIHIHELSGCAPAPLAHYLKAFGILRLVSEQVDPDARGWWDGDHFRLATNLDRKELEQFFLHEYQPTPLISPWNKGAGFFVNDPSLNALESSKSLRFSKFRSGIQAGRTRIYALSKADKKVRDIKAETKVRGMRNSEKLRIRKSENYKTRLREAEKEYKRLKGELIPNLRMSWRGPHREWMDAAMVLGDDGGPKYPPLLGTGGNDGRLDFTNNFMKQIGKVFDLSSDDGAPQPAACIWIRGSLWNVPEYGALIKAPVGQYLPGTAGGANNGNGPDATAMVNPMDMILMLEGVVAFTSHASRRFGLSAPSRVASPFVVAASGAAYASASAEDERGRGEQWMPLWSRPSSYRELQRLLAEGRAQVGARHASDSLDLASAVARLGTSRGLGAFQRYSYIERNGQTNLAIPLGRFDVLGEKVGHLVCIDDLDRWRRSLRREARSQNAPARLVLVEKRLADALFAVTKFPRQPLCWQKILVHLAEVEQTMAHGSGFGAGSVPPLRPGWVVASDDGTSEFRLALAFALQRGLPREKGSPMDDSVRGHWLPLDREQPWRFAVVSNTRRLKDRPEVVMHGRCGLDDAIALVERRLIQASQSGERYLPLRADRRISAGVADLNALLAGRVDLDRTLTLARAFMALDRKAWADSSISVKHPRTMDWPDDAWLAIRLCMLSRPLTRDSGFKLDIGSDPALIRRLVAGDAGAAVDLALRRLGAAGVRTTVRTGTTSINSAKLWAAALAFPVTEYTAKLFLHRLDSSKELL